MDTMNRSHATALIFGGFALGCVVAPARAQTGAKIRIAAPPIEAAAQVYYARETGLFAKAGLDVDLQPMQTTSATAAAIVSDFVDIGYGTVDTLANLHQKGIPVVIIAPGSEYVFPATRRSGALVVPANSLVRNAKDLNGKTISSPSLHGLADVVTSLWLDRNGADTSTIKFVEVPFPAIPAALEAGRIDAGFVAEPFITMAVKKSRVLAYPFDVMPKHVLVSAWFSARQWATDHAAVVSQFAAVMHDTAAWANKNPAQSGEILVKLTKLDPAIVAAMTRSRYAEQLLPALMQPIIDVSAKYDGFIPFPARDLIYTPPR
jgi:NitT/TauT family transport system substrate-binding protein